MQKEQHEGITLRGGTNLLYLLASGHSTCFTVFTRHSFGVDALGIDGIAALVVMFVYTCVTGSPGVVRFGAIWFVALALQRVITFVRGRGGWYEHSLYEGYLWLGYAMPFARKVEAAKLCEMFVCLYSGVILCGMDEPLGRFVLFGFFSLLVKASIESEIERKKVQRMRDAEIEMRQLVDRMKQRGF